ncbi:MAG: type II toxin-antitoxin system VapB family antitoxin [Ramlibacter sp.]|nr:type II toxin-antitoxin system VapB family antitoxin [Ramlibacter sp.]
MITNIDIDEEIVAEAMKLTGARTKREVVDKALRELVGRAKRTRFRDIFGIATEDDFWPNYDPKTDPGEPAGKYRVEQPRAAYVVTAAAPIDPLASLAKSKSRRPRK